jgi:hypothetical protein
MVTVVNFNDPRASRAINTTSRSTNWSRDLSPFFCGPVDLYGEYKAQNVENAWQYAKVYSKHVDQNNDPTDEYWEWAKSGWASSRAERYPMGKGAIPLFSYWDGDKLEYIEARKKIYAPLYSSAVEKTDAWAKLKKIYEESEDIILADFDAYDHRSLGMGYKAVLNSKTRKMGHAFVLAMMLEDQRLWEVKLENPTPSLFETLLKEEE